MTLSISLVNTGTERSNMSVAINGNTNANGQITVSRKGIETLRGVIEMGEKFAAPAEKVEETLVSRLKGFPNGGDVLSFLETKKVSVADYVSSATEALKAARIKEPVGRAKKGDGNKTKQNKFLLASATKLTCNFITPTETGEVTEEMLLAGYNAALEAFKDVDTDTVVAAAMKLVKERGIDSDGRIRLRGEGSKSEE